MKITKKTFLVFSVIIVLVIVFSYILGRVSPTTPATLTVPIIPTNTNTGTGGTYTEPAATDLTQVNKEIADTVAQKEKDKLLSSLPITVHDISTSVGITTNINVFLIASEPSQMIHIEIYGPNYNLSDATLDNPQAVAFIESFNQVKGVLTEKGINISNLQIIYGTRDYIQTTAVYWVKYFKLLP